jgi:hypothetical protein
VVGTGGLSDADGLRLDVPVVETGGVTGTGGSGNIGAGGVLAGGDTAGAGGVTSKGGAVAREDRRQPHPQTPVAMGS